MRRKACDDAIFYAQKKRRAFGEPEYTVSELAEMKAPRGKGDLTRVSALILASNQRLWDQRQAEQRLARVDPLAAQRREAEIRLYRA